MWSHAVYCVEGSGCSGLCEYVNRVSPSGVPEVYFMTVRYATVMFEHTELS
jgi:hypothetical protein